MDNLITGIMNNAKIARNSNKLIPNRLVFTIALMIYWSIKLISIITEAIDIVIEIINNTTIEFKDIPSIDKTIANRYNQKLKDVQEWLSLTEWSQDVINETTVSKVQNELIDLDIMKKRKDYNQIVKILK